MRTERNEEKTARTRQLHGELHLWSKPVRRRPLLSGPCRRPFALLRILSGCPVTCAIQHPSSWGASGRLCRGRGETREPRSNNSIFYIHRFRSDGVSIFKHKSTGCKSPLGLAHVDSYSCRVTSVSSDSNTSHNAGTHKVTLHLRGCPVDFDHLDEGPHNFCLCPFPLESLMYV